MVSVVNVLPFTLSKNDPSSTVDVFVAVWSASLTNLSKLSSNKSPISCVVEDAVTASVGGIIMPSSSVWGSSSDLLPERFSSLPVAGISDSFVGGAVSSGIGIIFILRLVADATTTSVITANSPITIAEGLIATIWVKIWEMTSPFTMVVIRTFKKMSMDILIVVTFFDVGLPISNSQLPTRSLATW